MSKQFSYEEIKAARELLGLPEKATMNMIKEHFRTLCHLWHPDIKRQDTVDCDAKMREINKAYELIIDYCNQYQFSFAGAEVEKRAATEDWWLKQFGNDPMWGPGNEKED